LGDDASINRDGGGNGVILGSMVVANFDPNAPQDGFTAPTFNTSGGGTSDVKYDSNWTKKALGATGFRIGGFREN
jgi:hypothetical protein